MNNPDGSNGLGASTAIPDEELWRAHERSRETLVAGSRKTVREQLERRGAGYDDVAIGG
jgi:hypothetical protein